MAVTVSTLVWQLPPRAITAVERLVLLALADYSRHDGAAWPAVATLVRRTSLCRRTIQNTLPRLVQLGFLVPDGVMARGSIRYRIDLATLEEAASTTRPDCAPHAQSPRTTCAVEAPNDCAPRARGGAPHAQISAPGAQGGCTTCTRSVIDPLDPSVNKITGADAPACSLEGGREEARQEPTPPLSTVGTADDYREVGREALQAATRARNESHLRQHFTRICLERGLTLCPDAILEEVMAAALASRERERQAFQDTLRSTVAKLHRELPAERRRA